MPATNTTKRTGVSVTTTDATVTDATLFTTQSNKAYHVVAKVVATETADHDEVAGYIRAATFKNDGGTLTQVGSTTAVATHEDTAGWDVTLDATGTTIRLRVTGAAATVINWRVDLEILEVE